MNRGDRRERAAPQHPLGELHVESIFEGQHQRDAGVRRQAGFVEAAIVGQRGFSTESRRPCSRTSRIPCVITSRT